jgi:hypothetical protein
MIIIIRDSFLVVFYGRLVPSSATFVMLNMYPVYTTASTGRLIHF